MPVRAGINGFGRIGRNVFRAAHDCGEDIDWVGVNDITDTKTLAQLLRYDSILGPFPGEVEHTENSLIVDGDELRVFAERDPADLPWGDVGAEVVIESTGHHHGACDGAGRNARAGRERRRLRPAAAPRDLERVLHDQLPGAGGQGPPRRDRDRARDHDHDPRVHVGS